VNQEAYIPDTIVKVEYKVDTVIVERIDTVVIENNALARKNDDEANRVLNLASKSLEFTNDKAIILKSSYGDLEALVNMMLVREDLRIRLEGHTDNNGTDEYNLNLSKNRVNAVKEFLVANGVEASRIETTYFGESKPIADNSSENGKAKNRRVELHYIR
jgi:outer membrane protein OmpA-like peptidoglycan-associated protein